jgi:hypothetical protein
MLKKSAGRTEFVLGCWRYCAANSAMGTPTALLTAQTQLERLYLHQLQCSAVQCSAVQCSAKPQRNSNAAHFNQVSFRAAIPRGFWLKPVRSVDRVKELLL